MKTRKCCECFCSVNRALGQGIYCTECYDSINPPPLKMHVKYQGSELSYYARDDKVLEVLAPIANGLANAIQGGAAGNQRMLKDTPRN
ncbi:hypothetical protein OS493_018463 [Desmophyllum pertusum]|uniref:Uncharacterized protein n=1 Tax=Desmophyllum pertusum TaxID=174260 RepID=A0A9X0A200_9CNID|nr:hypothetical protein OS493_018463 [Desmophyllum pertusum]